MYVCVAVRIFCDMHVCTRTAKFGEITLITKRGLGVGWVESGEPVQPALDS